MMLSSPLVPSPMARLAERLELLRQQHGFELLDGDTFATFAARPGLALVLFVDDPGKVPESWDIAVILPEIVRSLAAGLRVGLLAPPAATALAGRYGINFWPALLALRDGAFLGTMEGLKDWSVYAQQLPLLLAAAASRPPGIGIAVSRANVGTAH